MMNVIWSSKENAEHTFKYNSQFLRCPQFPGIELLRVYKALMSVAI